MDPFLNMRILVIEDEKKVARFLERGLKEERYAVDLAVDGEEGLYRALSAPYDLIVLDVLLPKRTAFSSYGSCAQPGVGPG